MATAPCSTDVFEHLDDAAREKAYRSAVSEAAALKTEVDQLRRELELLKMVPSKDHDAANDDDAPKPPHDPQLQASHDFLCNSLAPLIERIERLESRTHASRAHTNGLCLGPRVCVHALAKTRRLFGFELHAVLSSAAREKDDEDEEEIEEVTQPSSECRNAELSPVI
ncbi:hypothetical protein HPB50_007527 [Hyalomma asiaticum]|uniref:Uncharacterized protein n=1 Tax=Hyalomma asiaticum TaxID=266040 RepID=A0ACB7T638_HYAAI|nr:hypothetical protein HPB50_007527 [Hyalomma asiaticum]